MYIDVNEYIKTSREERRSHLKLEEKCLEIGGSSRNFRGLLAHHLQTTIPSGFKIVLCHACHNAKCSNPNHLYWGTNGDNSIDAYENGKKAPVLSFELRQKISKVALEQMRIKRAKEIINGTRKVTRKTSPKVLKVVEKLRNNGKVVQRDEESKSV